MPYLNIFTSYKWSMPLFTRPFGVRIFILRTIKHVLGTHLIATGNLKLMNYFYKLNHEHAICFPWVNIILITESKSAFKHNKLSALCNWFDILMHLHICIMLFSRLIFLSLILFQTQHLLADLHLEYIIQICLTLKAH